MPKLTAKRKNLDGLTDAQKELYVEQEDGTFLLDAEGVEDTGGLRSALEKERTARKELERKLKKLGDIDPDEVERLREESEERANEEKDVEKRIAKLTERHTRELRDRDEKIAARDKKIHTLVAENVARSAIEEEGGKPKVLLPHVLSHVKVIEEDGDFVAVIIDEKGAERHAKSGTRMPIKDLVAELKGDEDFAGAFDGTGASGSGAQPNGDRGTPPAGERRKIDQEAVGAKRATGAYSI